MRKRLLTLIKFSAIPLIFDPSLGLRASAARAQSQSNKPIILTVKADLSLCLGSDVVTRDGLAVALEAATNGNRDERIIVRPGKGVSFQDLMAVAISLGRVGYVSVTVWGSSSSSPTAERSEPGSRQ
jgi:biopolymer transport protein ExbD